MEETIGLRRARQTEAAFDAIRSGIGKRTMDRIRLDIASMSDVEARLLKERSNASGA